MEKLRELLEEYVSINLHQIILSKVKADKNLTKVKIRPVLIKDMLYFQATSTVGTKELHKNYEKKM